VLATIVNLPVKESAIERQSKVAAA